jgi:hypothetical protein
MPENVHIALDAMGGDHGAPVVVEGAAISLERHPDTKFVIVGSQPILQSLLATRPARSDCLNARHRVRGCVSDPLQRNRVARAYRVENDLALLRSVPADVRPLQVVLELLHCQASNLRCGFQIALRLSSKAAIATFAFAGPGARGR